ncbi:MAG: carbohydrate binding domain-containing protein [Planctomycetota bacterium]|jgi:hypothetical protein
MNKLCWLVLLNIIFSNKLFSSDNGNLLKESGFENIDLRSEESSWKLEENSSGVGIDRRYYKGRRSLRIKATDSYSGVYQFIKHNPSSQIYKISFYAKTDLRATIKAVVGIDYYDKDNKLIRHADTKIKPGGILKCGLQFVSGRTGWIKYVVYAYDVPKKTASLKVWCGLNPWNTPYAKGYVWFDEISLRGLKKDSAWPIGYPPMKWQGTKKLKPKESYVLQVHGREQYLLPAMPETDEESHAVLSAASYPGAREEVTFSLFANKKISGMKVSISDLKNKKSQMIKAVNLNLRRVRYIYRKVHYMTSDYLLTPNHVEEFSTVDIAAGQRQQFWLTVNVPENMSGDFEGRITFSAPGVKTKTLPVRLHVMPITVIDPPEMLWGMFHYDKVYSWKKSGFKEKTDYIPWLKRDLADLYSYGFTTVNTFNTNLDIDIVQDKDGKVRIKWDQKKGWAAIMNAYRDQKFKEPIFIYPPWKVTVASEKYGGKPGTEGFRKVYKELFRQIVEEGKKRKWSDFYILACDNNYPYIFDENHFKMARILFPVFRELGIKTYTFALNHPLKQVPDFEKEFYSQVDIFKYTFCHPPISGGSRFLDGTRWESYRKKAEKDNKTLIAYNIDVSGVHPEALRYGYGVALWKLGLKGVINWIYRGVNRYNPDDTQGRSTMSNHFLPRGEFKGGPTIALLAAGEGIKDYKLLYTLKTLIEKNRKGSNSGKRKAAAAAEREVDGILKKLDPSSVESNSYLSLGKWDKISYDKEDRKIVCGNFKINNGFKISDYDILRSRVMEYILLLQK